MPYGTFFAGDYMPRGAALRARGIRYQGDFFSGLKSVAGSVSKYLPGVAAAFPTSKGVQNALKLFSSGGALAGIPGAGALGEIAGAISSPAALPATILAGIPNPSGGGTVAIPFTGLPAAIANVAHHFGGGGRKRFRTLQVTNMKALNRALRRVEGFKKLATRTGLVQKKSHRAPARARACLPHCK